MRSTSTSWCPNVSYSLSLYPAVRPLKIRQNQNQTNYPGPLQQMQTAQWTNQNSKQILVTGVNWRENAYHQFAIGFGLAFYWLRTMSTFLTAHTFRASQDTRVSYGWCLLIKRYFYAVENYAEKAEYGKCFLVSQKKIGRNHAFFRDNKASI